MNIKKVGVFLICAVMLLASGCLFKNSAEESFKKYIALLKAKNYQGMYECLSKKSKEYISKDDFVKKYTNIYNSIDASNISISYKKGSKNKSGYYSIPYSFKMNTSAGEMNFDSNVNLAKENGGEWKIEWDEKMIHPLMEKGDKIAIATTKGKRGNILDRNGNAIAYNSDIYSVGVVPGKLGDTKDATISSLSSLLGISSDQINKTLSAGWVKDNLFVPIGAISTDDSKTKDSLLQLKGVGLQKKEGRVYPFKEAACQLSGYVGLINSDELKNLKAKGYTDSDYIGKTGLEKIYEDKLKAKDGKEIYTVDSKGNKKKTLIKSEAKDGQDIHLTINIEIQKEAYDELKGDVGTAVVIDPKTGEVLAAVSTPGYDPNDFILGLKTGEYDKLMNDAGKPFTAKFVQSYSPGSIFKPVTAGIGLTLNKINPDEKMMVKGLTWQKDKSWGSYSVTRVRDTGNPVDLMKALVYSDNIYFAQAALKIGSDDFIKGAKSFGIGEKLPFEIGLDDSYIDKSGKIGNEIQLADSGYGQGKVMVTPINIAAAYTALINSGNVIKPVLVSDASQQLPVIYHENAISSSAAKIISDDLVQVVSAPDGSCHDAAISGEVIAGKTGTPELKTSLTDKEQKMNGWFVGYRQDNPKILAVMMVEDVGKRGESHYVVPKVRKLIEDFSK